MSEYPGEELLRAHQGGGVTRGVQRINDRVYFITGYGPSNAVLAIGEHSCLLIDALNDSLAAEQALEEVRKVTKKPIDCLIYTHLSHPDHSGGASVLAKGVSNVIARRSSGRVYEHSQLLQDIGGKRGARQFGAALTDEEAISNGAGPLGERGGKCQPLPPTEFIENDKAHFDVDGVEVVLLAAPGETDDHTYVWLPEDGVLCCGDNYYQSWPNLSAIRGGQYRDVAMWIESLDKLLAFNAQYLLPGHSQAILGEEAIRQTITNYRDGLEYVLLETLKGMNQGLTPDQLVQTIELPQHLCDLPQLAEMYGTITASIRGIYSGYLGWFDGNPTHLGSLPPEKKAQKTLALMGGAQRVLEEARQAIEGRTETQWGLELCDLLLDAGQLLPEAQAIKAQGLIHLGRMATSANERHYYLTCAKELQGQL